MEMLGENSIFNLEYRNGEDDAWYTARVKLFEGNDDDNNKNDVEEPTLIVKFEGFSEVSDVKYSVGQFKSVAEVDDEFLKRFRVLSEQVQDRDCRKISKGSRVCAALSCHDDDLRYFDAVVEAVDQQEHVFTNGEEECMCTFILFWLHGPSLGNLTAAGIANICSIQIAAQVNPVISYFSRLAKKRIQIASSHCSSELHEVASRGPARCEESGSANGSDVELQIEVLPSSGKSCRNGEQSDSDEDLGGDLHHYLERSHVAHSNSLHIVLINNLETDLSPTKISRFIFKQTSITPEAFVFPCQSLVPYTSGALVLDSETKLQKIFEFLINPEHIIVSARGRPWIITGKMLWHGMFRSAAHISELKCEENSMNRELKVVHLGTEAYKRAEQLRELFVEFLDHLSRIHKRLSFEEAKILQSFQ